MIHSEFGFGLFGRGAPGGDAVAAQDGADGLRVGVLDRGDVQAQLEPGTAPRNPEHLVAEDLGGQGLAVHGRGNRDARVRVQVVHVRGIHEPVHGGVDRRCSAALAVQAVIECGHHLVFAVHAGVDVLQCVAAGPGAARQGFPASACRGPRRSPSPRGAGRPRPSPGPSRRPWPRCCRRRSWCSACPHPGGWNVQSGLQQSCWCSACSCCYAPHPACWPPTRSSLICFW